MLTFLKRLRPSSLPLVKKEHSEDSDDPDITDEGDQTQAVRLVNILIITLQITVNVSTFLAAIISIGQEGSQFMMVKTFVALKFISDIDRFFTRCMPA